MKIAYFVQGGEYGGGMSVQAFELMRHFKSIGHDVSLICSGRYHLISDARELGIDIFPIKELDSSRRRLGINDLIGAFKTYSILRRIKPDILHSHCIKGGYMASFLGEILGIKGAIMTVHGWPFTEISSVSSALLKVLLRSISFMVGKMVLISDHDQKIAVKYGFCPPPRTVVVYNGIKVPDDCSPARPKHQFNIVFVGRLVVSKDPYTLLAAAARLKDLDLHLKLIGDGPERKMVAGRVRSLGIGDRVEMTGEMSHDETMREIGKSHLLVLTTRREGFGLVLLEAMSRKTPCIATRIGGVPEQLRDGINGFLIDPGDAMTLAERIALLYKDRDLAERMGDAGWQIAKKEFSLDKMLSMYLRTYQDVLA